MKVPTPPAHPDFQVIMEARHALQEIKAYGFVKGDPKGRVSYDVVSEIVDPSSVFCAALQRIGWMRRLRFLRRRSVNLLIEGFITGAQYQAMKAAGAPETTGVTEHSSATPAPEPAHDTI